MAMLVNLVKNVSEGLYRMSTLLHSDIAITEKKPSRNGPVKSLIVPVTTGYGSPRERVLLCPLRDANPFFHLFESLWMLGGSNDVEFLKRFNSTIQQFSDDGKTFHGAYGHRWRHHFSFDQIKQVVKELRYSITSRRAVLTMWDAYLDPEVALAGGKDVPCNTHIYFGLKDDALDMTVCCRSNDLVWGCYGANAVHMSMLHEYVSLAARLPMGKYYQMSNDLHVYEKHWLLMDKLAVAGIEDPYKEWNVSPWLWKGEDQDLFDLDVKRFLENHLGDDYDTVFMNDIVRPMANAFEHYHLDNPYAGAELLGDNPNKYDWLEAGRQWLLRRSK